MNNKRILFLITILSTFIYSSQSVLSSNKDTEQYSTNDIYHFKEPSLIAINLDYGFKILIGRKEAFQDFNTYSYLELIRNNTTIYIDSSLTEYEFNNKLFPILINAGENSFELLIEVNNRPNKNFLKIIYIQDNKLSKQDELPAFESSHIDINKDGIKEYAGFWDYFQIWEENNNLTSYNPILYYSITPNGLFLDSLLTKQRNEMIYGAFYGFSFDETKEQPISVIKKFEKELELINGKQ